MSAHDFDFTSIDGEAAAPRWNFHKYLIAPDGELAGMWPSKVEPTSREIVAAVEALVDR